MDPHATVGRIAQNEPNTFSRSRKNTLEGAFFRVPWFLMRWPSQIKPERVAQSSAITTAAQLLAPAGIADVRGG